MPSSSFWIGACICATALFAVVGCSPRQAAKDFVKDQVNEAAQEIKNDTQKQIDAAKEDAQRQVAEAKQDVARAKDQLAQAQRQFQTQSLRTTSVLNNIFLFFAVVGAIAIFKLTWPPLGRVLGAVALQFFPPKPRRVIG